MANLATLASSVGPRPLALFCGLSKEIVGVIEGTSGGQATYGLNTFSFAMPSAGPLK
jgi:hypothetical protein